MVLDSKITFSLLAVAANWCAAVMCMKIVSIPSSRFYSAVMLLQFCLNTSEVIVL